MSEGYLNRETLNKERFKADPFRGHGKMFRTRDLGRWNSRGKLIHLGRTDDQVKIKGFRVELEAISTVLEKEPSCQASVSIKLDSHNLVSFVKPISAKTQKMVERVKEELPYFYEPTQIIALNTFPLTDRGKVDRKQLALIAANELNSQRKKQKKGIDSHA